MTSKYDDKTLREAFASLAADARPGDECPSPERLWAAIVGELPVDERHTLVDHIAICPSCAEDWRAARRMGARPPAWWKVLFRAVRKSWAQKPPWVPRTSGALAALAAVVLALVVAFRAPQPGDPSVPQPERQIAFRGIAAEDAPELPLSRESCWLRWTHVEGAVHYDLTVTTEALEPVAYVQGLTATEYRLSEEDLKTVASGQSLLWLVEAKLLSGQRVSSPAFVSPIK